MTKISNKLKISHLKIKIFKYFIYFFFFFAQDCGCEQTSLHLHAEIEDLKQKLLEKENHIVNMETNFLCEAEKFPHGEYAALTDEIIIWQDKYARLVHFYKRYFL